MSIIDRYIYAIGKHLPRKNKTDIQNELRSNLADTLEARYGEEPSEEQVIALVKEMGKPEKVAASYWPEGQYLVGPRLYPLFRMVVGIVITVFVIVNLVLFGVMVAFKPETLKSLEFVTDLFGGAISAFGMIVLVFAILQRLDVRPEDEKEDWDPRELPEIDEKETINRTGVIVEIIFATIFTAILVAFGGRLGGVVSLGSEMVPNPALGPYVPLLVLSLLLAIGLDIFLLWRGRWELGSRIAKIAVDLFGVGVLLALVLSHNTWLAQHGITGFMSWVDSLPSGSQFSTEQVQIMIVSGFRIGFVVALIVSSIEAISEIFRLVRGLLTTPRVPVLRAK